MKSSYNVDCRVYCTYSSFELSGSDTEADGNIEADSWSIVLSAQRHLSVNILRQSQRRLHLDHWTGSAADKTQSEKL